MADQRNFARTVVAVSSAVVAVCAVAVTIKVMSTDGISVKQPRVLDQAALERQVAAAATSIGLHDEGPVEVECPTSVVVEVGNQFDCNVSKGSDSMTVVVKIIGAQGEISTDALI